MSSWKEVLVNPADTLKEAVSVLHKGGLRIALVVDEAYRLLGTVTDGDIRRALINDISMGDKVELVMNRHPVTVSNNVDKKGILTLMESLDLLHIPILDDNGILSDLVTLQHMHKELTHDNPVFIMAGGFGKRLQPLTKETPKPLLKVGKKPILNTIIEQFVNFGFHNFYISTHYMSEKIRDNFSCDKEFSDLNINFIHEDKPLGTAGSLGLLPKDIPELPIIIMNGDLLTKVDFKHLLDFHKQNKSEATVCVREYDFHVPYGVVKIDNHRINEIKEKPVYKFFVNAGIYVLNKSLIKKISGNSYLDMTDFLEDKLDSKIINAFPIYEYWLDIGHMEEYERANREIDLVFGK